MTRRRFFHEDLSPGQGEIVLDGKTSHHLLRVLRMGPGARVELCNGRGLSVRARIVAGRKGRAVAVEEAARIVPPNPVSLCLAVPLAKSDRMDLVVRQAVELGVTGLLIFRARRSQYHLEGDRKQKRLARYGKIAQEALCQCGRAWLPDLDMVDGLEHLLERVARTEGGEPMALVASEVEPRRSLLSVWRERPTARRLVGAVGPEGGWADEELEMFRERGFIPVSLGAHVLRFETACVAMAAGVQLLWGERSMP
ncbi:16S rRNA (uracil1498-N3)-methyltransferase [Desulfacinum hydrothermale DSM 13146]|uniref:Ribosomal RNA small subunit methyltransferase E n=1 Tax=Desulfacinum hydrothermale DSM 13146 TaxID=1121390 RepID=A0A1W1XMY9_9BACT|nr:RsmE family RNA methyltransferase [Desulfacinum hydrothermale]SMC25215.1 16S rRNA (uracil1498-N3)-methyltransferase [Desulfacinum hydrothermale DSM 13146]